MPDRHNIPVLVGAVPLVAVTSFVVNEGYKTASIGGSSLKQMVSPTTKTISIEALLIDKFRTLRPALEVMALTSRALASVAAPLLKIAGIPVVTRSSEMIRGLVSATYARTSAHTGPPGDPERAVPRSPATVVWVIYGTFGGEKTTHHCKRARVASGRRGRRTRERSGTCAWRGLMKITRAV